MTPVRTARTFPMTDIVLKTLLAIILLLNLVTDGTAALGKVSVLPASPKNTGRPTEAKQLMADGNARSARGDVPAAVDRWTQAEALFAQERDQ